MATASDPDGRSGHRQRLRERFARTGFAGFADHEVIELLLTLAIPRRDVKPQAKALLAHFGGVRQVLDASPEALAAVPGMGTVAPMVFRIVREASDLYLRQQLPGKEAFQSLRQIEDYYRQRLSGLRREVFEVAYLDHQRRLIDQPTDRVEEGDIDAVYIYPRRLLSEALKRQAAGLILVHNHPGGAAQPSADDRRLTQQLQQAAAALDIEILDHLIIAGDTVFSFRREGLLEPTR